MEQRNRKMNKLLRCSYALLIFFISVNCFALTQNDKLWLAVNSQQTLSVDKKWHSFIYSQFRYINESHAWQAALIEGGIGYRFLDNESIWLEYRWTGHDPYNGFFQENRLFQQLLQIKKFNAAHLILRARLEEIQISNSSQISVRLRERIAVEIMHGYFWKMFPFLYDEVFFQLKNTDYTSNKFINQNRLFIGFNLYTGRKSWWEIGYINQFQMRTPQNVQNTMSHIFSVTYNF